MDQYLLPQESILEEEYWKVQGLWNGNFPREAHISKELPSHREGNIWEIVVVRIDPIEVRDPLKEEGIQIGMEDCLIEGDILIGIEDLLEEGISWRRTP